MPRPSAAPQTLQTAMPNIEQAVKELQDATLVIAEIDSASLPCCASTASALSASNTV
jgi:hypothetical protein